MGSNGTYVKQFFVYISLLILVSCETKQDLPKYFSDRNYEEIEKFLKSRSVDWELALWQNKLYYESKRLKPYSVSEIFQLMKSDELFDYSEFKLFYYKTPFHPYNFLKDLIDVEDRFKRTIKSHYYHEIIMNLLRSKRSKNRDFAYNKLLTNYHRRYHHLFYETVARMKLDTIYPSKFIDDLEQLASQFERIEEIKSFKHKYNSSKFSVEKTKNMISGYRYGKSFSKEIVNSDKLDIHLMRKQVNLLPFIKMSENFRYTFILSGKKFHAESFDVIEEIVKDSSITTIEKSGVLSLLEIQEKDSLHYLFRFPLATAVHRAIFEQWDRNVFSAEILQSYLDLFVQRKLQRDIEKKIKICPKPILKNFIRKQLVVKNNKFLSYLIYWIGIAKLNSFYSQVESYLNHDDRIVAYEAEVTLKRLKKL